MKLSAIIIAKNEEEMLPDCLDSLKWADEIVVVDIGSEDKTPDTAKRHGARVIEYSSGGNFSDWRNKGAEEAHGNWILYVDADERVTPELKEEILSIINQSTNQPINASAYAIPRKNFIFGKEFRFGGQWPDYVKRLFKRSEFGGWSGELHEEPKFKGDIGHLENPLIHLKHETLSEMVDKTNDWSQIEATLMYKTNHPPINVLRFFSAMFREAWLRFVRELAFLDGAEGIIYGLYQVYSRSISYTKLWELQLKSKN